MWLGKLLDFLLRPCVKQGHTLTVAVLIVIFVFVLCPGLLFAALWTAECLAPLPIRCFQARMLEWLPFPSPGDLPHPGPEPCHLLSLLHCRQSLYHWTIREARLLLYFPPNTPASLIARLTKNRPAMQQTPVRSWGREDTLEKVMATHSSILAWRISWTV